eukprot:2947867-Prymnesium_polylepis.1
MLADCCIPPPFAVDCAPGYHGARCELCTQDNYYFDSEVAQCKACGDVVARSGVAVLLVIVLFTGIGGLVLAVRSQSSSRMRIVRRIIRQLRRFDVLYQAAAMQSKVKLGFGVWQCLSAAPAVFGISIPDGGDHLNALSNLLTFPAILGVDLILPGSCYGSFRPRLLVNALWPFALMTLTVLCGTAWE